jgi:ribulose-5-phosphate 4-epimerase/fuculose-1-phosphate aldolase
LHFYDSIAYHTYNSLELNHNIDLIKTLDQKRVLLMRHHGALTMGTTVQEAMFYTYHLEKACQTQCLILSQNRPYQEIPQHICTRSHHDLISFEKDLGMRDWQAWLRWIQ